MSEHQGHRSNWVSSETANSRFPSPLSHKQAKKARELISRGSMTHEQAAAHFGCELAELIAATADMRGKGQGHGNAVLNVKPSMRDTIKEEFQHEGEAAHAAVERLWFEYQHYRVWAEAMGCPPLGSLISLSSAIPVPAIGSH